MTDSERELDVVRAVVSGFERHAHWLLPILQALQQRIGHLPPASLAAVASHLNLSRAEVHGVATFYHDLRDHPAGRHRVQVCLAEACQSVGARALAAHAERVLGTTLGSTTEDGIATLEAVYCLGNCACGPSLRIDERVLGRVDAARFDELLARLRAPDSAS